ncbi:glycoside hydrolase family 5 protein [Spirochaetia bacterium 38H-sp]|uniref:Glycoside hydrolase family 5 protein n=1 Tax=Rarispira pelagica TaxID=3141764 RepID=A0ABU9UD74_9SPIR
MNKLKFFATVLILILLASCVSSSGPGGRGVVDEHGMLGTHGRYIVDEHGYPVAVKGMSLFWSQWSSLFWNKDVVHNLVKDWNISIIRCAMGVEIGGYLNNHMLHKKWTTTVVDAAIEEGIYVIIDWHTHGIYLPQAKEFFAEMAAKYANVPNVIFEVFNEPDTETWPQIKEYALEIIKVIRDAGANNLIVVGTPDWSKDVDIAAIDPITGFDNIAYTFHFYAGTHRDFYRQKVKKALEMGLPIFVTEWGVCDASGNGGVDFEESERWLEFMDENMLSWANWSFNDKDESASALVINSDTHGPWPEEQITESGKFVRSHLLKESLRVGEEPVK